MRSFFGRRHTAVPLAILSSACALRPWTPSVSVEQWRQDPQATRVVERPNAQAAMSWWQLPPSSPWARYQKMTLLAALGADAGTMETPDIWTLDVVQRASSVGKAIAQAGLPVDTLWMIDLRGAASVALGTAVSQHGNDNVDLVLTFNNWPAPVELVPAEETLAALVTMRPRAGRTPDVPAKPFFLLDAWRLAYRNEQPDDAVTDNRYMLSPSDMPDPAALIQQGIRRVIYLVEDLDDTDSEEDDLNKTLLAYQQSGVAIYLVDLSWGGSLEATRMDEALLSHRLDVRPRRTLVEDPAFYARSQGGFGGPRLGPSPFIRYSRFYSIHGRHHHGGGGVGRHGGTGGRGG